MNGLKLLQRQQQANGTKGAYVFINERLFAALILSLMR